MSIMRFRHKFFGVPVASFFLCLVVLILCASGPPTIAQEKRRDSAEIAYTKDVASIFQKNCLQCHQPGAIGPMSLTTYQEVRPWARAIKEKVLRGEMPPYRYDRNVGIQDLKYDLRLTEAEMQTIAQWVDSGAPQGDLANLPPPIAFPDPRKWAFEDQFGQPDIIVKTKPYTIEAKGQDQWWKPVVPVGLAQDRCIKAVSVKPSVKGRAAAHHANSD